MSLWCSIDRYEWNNLAEKPEHAARLASLRKLAPKTFAKKIQASDDSLTKLPWHPATKQPAPASQPDGGPFGVVFINRSGNPAAGT